MNQIINVIVFALLVVLGSVYFVNSRTPSIHFIECMEGIQGKTGLVDYIHSPFCQVDGTEDCVRYWEFVQRIDWSCNLALREKDSEIIRQRLDEIYARKNLIAQQFYCLNDPTRC